MSDDTRQARVDAAMAAYDAVIDEAFARNTPNGKGFRQAITAAIDAADAVGRRWVSAQDIELRIEHERDMADTVETVTEVRYHNARISVLREIIDELTAAPAERGHDETGWDAIESGSVERAEWESAQRNGYVWDDEVKP